MTFTRRDLGKIAIASLGAGKLLAKPDSNFGGVQIGIIISPTALKGIPLPADQMLKNLQDAGLSAVEMQDVRMEAYAGAPAAPHVPRGQKPTAEQQEAQKKAAQQIREWRMAPPMEKYRALRKMYDEAGVKIYAFRCASLNKNTPVAEYAYYFDTAAALGANQLTIELPPDEAYSQRLGDYAAKRGIRMAYHNHTQVNFHSWDKAFAQSKGNGANFDVGHYTAAVSESPIPFIEKHYARIGSLHLKDRKLGTKGGQNMPWGQGDTPLKEILLMMKKDKKKYGFPAGIELEYPIPEGSTSMAEIVKCVQFCKNVLA